MEVDIKSMINENTVEFNVDLKSKEEVLEYISEILVTDNRAKDKRLVLDGLLKREKEGTTGVGFQLAIPHCKGEVILKPTIVYLSLKNPIDWCSLDGEPVKVIIGLAIPKEQEGTLHIKLLSALASNLMEEEFKDKLFKINNKKELIDYLYRNLQYKED